MGKYQIPFDYFSLPARGFNTKGHDSTKSWYGFILTLGFFGLVISIFITEIVSMARRESLTVSIAEEGVPYPPPTNIKSIKMAFGVMSRASSMVSMIENVDFNIKAEAITTTFFGENPRQIAQQTKPITMKRCTDVYFGDMVEQVREKINIPDIFCLPTDQDDELFTLEGQLGSDVFRSIKVSILCGQPGDTTCPATFVTSNVLFVYGATSMNVSNFETPITVTPTAFRDHADRTSYHEKTISITPREIITDTGLIFSDLETRNDLIVSIGSSLTEGVNVLLPEVFAYYITLDPNKIVVKRDYKMILDVLASTTGIASTVAFVVCFLLKPYLEEKAHNDVMRNISPEKHQSVTLIDYFKALTGDKAAKQKVRITEEEKEWVTQNLDMIKLMKNWSDFEKMKKNMVIESERLQDAQEMSSFRTTVDLSRIHPK